MKSELLSCLIISFLTGCATAPINEDIGDYTTKDIIMLIGDLKNKNTQVRSLAVQALGSRGLEAIEPLLLALNDSSRQVRINAMGTLTHIYTHQAEDSRILNILISKTKESDFYIKLSAVQCLGKMKKSEAVYALIEALQDRRESYGESISQTAAKYLVKIGALAVEPLIQSLKDKDASVRYWTVKVLGQIGDTRAIEPLIGLLGDKSTVAFKRPTPRSPYCNSYSYYFPPTPLDDVRESKYISKPLPEAMQMRTYELGAKGMEEQISKAIKGMFGGNSIRISVGEQARAALINIGKPVAMPLIPLLKDRDSYVRYGAIYVLGSVKCPLAVKPLAEVLNSDTSPEVRKEAALALAMSGDQRALKFLKEALPRERRNDVKEIIEKSIEKLQNNLPEVMEGN